MGLLHEKLNKIINDFTELGIVDVSEEAQCFALEISSCVNDDLQKTTPIGGRGDGLDILKLNTEDLRERAQTLTETNRELKKQLDIRDYFEKHQRYYHFRDHERLMEISQKFIETGGKLPPDDLVFMMNKSDADLRHENEIAEKETRNRLKKLGGLRIS